MTNKFRLGGGISDQISERFEKQSDNELRDLVYCRVIKEDVHRNIMNRMNSSLNERLRMLQAGIQSLSIQEMAGQLEQKRGMSIAEIIMRKFRHQMSISKWNIDFGPDLDREARLFVVDRGVVRHTNQAYFEFLERIGVKRDEEMSKYCRFLKKVWAVSFDGIAIFVCKAPTRLRLDQRGQPHSTKGEAILWRDGTKNYFLYGVNFSNELWRMITDGSMSCLAILMLDNIEQRMAALKLYGAERILEELDARLIDESRRGNRLYEIRNTTLNMVIKLLKYRDPSTGRSYASFVPGGMLRADQAMAWKFYLSEYEYSSLRIEA